MDKNALKLELNIALIPEESLAQRLTHVSRDIAGRYPARVQLDDTGARLSTAPHLTLYQAAFPLSKIPAVDERLAGIARFEGAYDLTSVGLAYNPEEGSIEDGKEVTSPLVTLQEDVIDATNSLRDGLLIERDPGGNVVAEQMKADGVLGENIRQTGYAEVGDPRTGGLFRPHDTLNWLVPHTALDVDAEQQRLAQIDLSGRYVAIGMYVMGQYGTCPQLIARHDFLY